MYLAPWHSALLSKFKGAVLALCMEKMFFLLLADVVHNVMQAKEVERDSILAQVTDQHERQRLINLFNNEREEAHKNIEALALQE